MIYFDNAATTPINKKALNVLFEKSNDCFGNPSAKYSLGAKARKALSSSRTIISQILNCNVEDLFFTSGGTESNNIVIQSFLRLLPKHSHIITSKIEHSSILKVLSELGGDMEITYLKPLSNGIVSFADLSSAIKPNTKFISIQYINNEVGSLQPIKEIGKIAKEKNIFFHVDAVQAVGHLRLDITSLQIDALSASAHKFGGPKGIGFLFCKNHAVFLNLGGGQEKKVRSGTENVPSICSMAEALLESVSNLETKQNHISSLVNFLEEKLATIPEVRLNVANESYHSIINFTVDGISNEALIQYFDINSICVSAGSACDGTSKALSHVLIALGFSDERVKSSIRISLSSNNTLSECYDFLEILQKGISLLRNI